VNDNSPIAQEDSLPDQGLEASAELHFDLENPRFIDQQFHDEVEIIQYLFDNYDVEELIKSILSAGFIDFEPFVVQRGTKIVFEGNRRLAALRPIQNKHTRKKLKIELPDIANPKPLPPQVRI
jgi:hypothetical protein